MTPNNLEEEVYDFIRAYIRQHRIPPTMREICAGTYLSIGTVLRCLDILEVRGRIARKRGKSRSINLLDD
jgi:SOS-response transcriptional repressor LexA